MSGLRWAASIAAAGWAAPALSRSLCYSRIAQDVRAALFAADFWPNLAALLLPFWLFLGFGAALIVGGWRLIVNGAQTGDPA